MVVEISLKNPVFECFAFYATVMILKVLFMGVLTAYYRITKKVFANPEDVQRFQGKVAVNQNDPQVERVRRNHLNDIENIIPFVLLGFLYTLTGPTFGAARLHFGIFAASRLLHMFIYQFAVPQPSRALSHMVGLGVNISMGFQIIMATMNAM